MNAKNLQKATVILGEIHELDRQIIELDKKAMSIADGKKFVSITLSFDLDKPKKEEIDTDGYNYKSILSSMYGVGTSYEFGSSKNTDTEIHKIDVSDKETLFIIGAIISCKKDYRNSLCQQIIELGVTV